MLMKAQIKLDIECDSRQTAWLLSEATAPDNSPLPDGMELNTVINKSHYKAVFTYSKNLSTLRNTIDDLLQSIQLVLEVTKPLSESGMAQSKEKER